MLTTPIRAVDERVLPFAPDQIWPVLADVIGYPQWYPPSLHLQVRAVTADGIGSEVELRPRGGRAFSCRVESLEVPRRLRLRESLPENSEWCCFWANGWMARRDEGEYPSWVFD